MHFEGLANNPGACRLELNSGKITNLKNIGLTTILNHGVNQNFCSRNKAKLFQEAMFFVIIFTYLR
jgi:hypothetical protein